MGVTKTDWSPLRGRDCIIWPDANDSGRDAAPALAAKLREARAASVKIVEPPEGVVEGWDLANAEADGLGPGPGHGSH